MKHFPGLGITRYNTDTTVVTITATRSRLWTDLAPVSDCDRPPHPADHAVERHVHRVDRVNAAGWSPAIGGTLLRRDLGYTGATITDSLTGTAAARGVP